MTKILRNYFFILLFILSPVFLWIFIPNIPFLAPWLLLFVEIPAALIAAPLTVIFCPQCKGNELGGLGFMLYAMYGLIFLITYLLPSIIYILTNKDKILKTKAVVLLAYLLYLGIFAAIYVRYIF